jgi:predicted TIM-barrel fold metal-dependent hydrolase
MSAWSEPKIDCHNHILDPQRYPYAPGVQYSPSGQEIGTEHQLHTVCDTYHVDHCLVVGPNSGYGTDNRCLLEAIARSHGRFKGVAVVDNDATSETLEHLKSLGIVGVAINATYHGCGFYRDIGPLIERLAALDLFLQIQVEGDQLVELMPLVEKSRVKILIDHCGRPDLSKGLTQPGFAALRALASNRRTTVKLSGMQKFSRQAYPYRDTWDYVRALAASFTLDHCVWGSDWPFLRAMERLDYGPLIGLVDQLFPDAADRRKLLWDTPNGLFGFTTSQA